MKVLVTGSEGFVGKHLCRYLLDRGDEVIRLDKRTTYDIADRYESTFERDVAALLPDVIVHLAGSCSTPGSLTSPRQTFHDTVGSAVEVLESTRLFQIPTIITSSVKATDGKTPYGAAKRMVELWATEYRNAYDLPIILIRPGTIYGPGQEGSTESGWIAWFTEAARTGKEVTINGDGWQLRDLLHISDFVGLLVRFIDNPYYYSDLNEGRYDVGGGSDNTVTVNQIARHLGLRTAHGPERYGDTRRYVGKNNVPGWEPSVKWWESETLAA